MKNEPKTENENENVEIHDKPVFEFNPDVLAGHEWRQQGPFIICKSCDLEHSMYIGVNRQLQGFDEDGVPVIKKIN